MSKLDGCLDSTSECMLDYDFIGSSLRIGVSQSHGLRLKFALTRRHRP